MYLDRFLNYLHKNERRVLLLLTVTAIFLRIIYVYLNYSKTGTNKFSDDFYYINAAEQIARGNWDIKYGDSNYLVVGPLLPILGALFLKLFNNLIIPFFIYNILVTSLIVPVLYYLSKEVFNEKIGWILAIWGVFFYEAFKYSPHVLKEPTLFLLVPLTLFFLVRSIKNNTPAKNIIFASLSYALLIHTDERFFIYFPFFALSFLLINPLFKFQFLKLTGIWIICVLMLMLPWSIWNYRALNQIVILTPRTTAITSIFWGDNLAEGASHFSNEGQKQKLIERRLKHAAEYGNEYGLVPREFGNFEARTRAFINFWQPAYFKPVYIQYGFRPQKWSLPHNMAGIFFYGVFLPFYLIGIFILLKRKLHLAFSLALIPIIHSLLHAYMIWPLERYRSPITFLIVMIGAFTIFQIIPELNIFFFKPKARS